MKSQKAVVKVRVPPSKGKPVPSGAVGKMANLAGATSTHKAARKK